MFHELKFGIKIIINYSRYFEMSFIDRRTTEKQLQCFG